MGLWGAAQAIAFGLGGFLGTVAVDVTRVVIGPAELAYAVVFLIASILFGLSALIAWQVAPSAALGGVVQSKSIKETKSNGHLQAAE